LQKDQPGREIDFDRIRRELIAPALERAERPWVLLFTGHMIDKPDRKVPRFPPDKEHVAREAIRTAVAEEVRRAGGPVIGIAGGASGGDILFHEVCAELGVTTQLYLALRPDDYINESVRPAGEQWVQRYHRLHTTHAWILGTSKDLPSWLSPKPDASVWERCNGWMLYNALAEGGDRVTLIALWDERSGDGPGGTEDLVFQAEKCGARSVILRTRLLFGL
jgi:hypothetical protein